VRVPPHARHVEHAAGDVLTEVEREELPPNEWFLWRRAPGALFHVAVGLLALSLLWVHSEPGVDLLPWLTVVLLGCLLVLVWAVRLLTFLLALTRGRSAGSALAWLAAPAVGVVVVVLVVAGIPLQARWAISRPAFDAVVEQRLGGGGAGARAPREAGAVRDRARRRRRGALLFFEGRTAHWAPLASPTSPTAPGPTCPSTARARLRFEPLGGPVHSWTGAED
jgi:hypothetical protein